MIYPWCRGNIVSMHIWESSNVGPYPPCVLISLPQWFLFFIILVQIETNSIARRDQDKTNDHHGERSQTFYVIGLVRSSLKAREDIFVHDLNITCIMKLHACLFSIRHEVLTSQEMHLIMWSPRDLSKLATLHQSTMHMNPTNHIKFLIKMWDLWL